MVTWRVCALPALRLAFEGLHRVVPIEIRMLKLAFERAFNGRMLGMAWKLQPHAQYAKLWYLRAGKLQRGRLSGGQRVEPLYPWAVPCQEGKRGCPAGCAPVPRALFRPASC